MPSPSTTIASAADRGGAAPPIIDAVAVRAGLARCGRIVGRHARALTAGDGDALRAVSAELSAIGLLAAAADAATQAITPRADSRNP